MTGRGIDQILPHPSEPRLFEPYVRAADQYVKLAEEKNGPIPRADYSYVWGDSLEELERVAPHARIINLETSVTTSDARWESKGIHYRMHPKNSACITAAGIGCCVLANNHVLDWGTAGLVETLKTLHGSGIRTAGAGRDHQEATTPAVLDVGAGTRILVFGFGTASSGVPDDWMAQRDRPGVAFLPDLTGETAGSVADLVLRWKRPGDIVVASIHWGGNWSYDVPPEHRAFAHQLIDQAGIDVIHGHSSHHAKAIEVYGGRPILYGCGDFLNDYEGITGYEEFRDDLVLMYFPTIERSSGALVRFEMTPLQIRRFRLNRTSGEDTRWLCNLLSREGKQFGTRAELGADDGLALRWS